MKIKLKRVHNKKRVLVGIFSVFAAFLGTFLMISFLVFRFKPVFQEKAECAAINKANLLINSAVTEALSGINEDDFVNIMLGESNSISAINTNTARLNMLKTKIYSNLTENLAQSGTSTVFIPIGSLTKYPALQGMGYKIPVKILFDTTFDIDFSDTLRDAGINQVYYETFVKVATNLDIISALMISSTEVTSKVPISQTLIVGTVPTHYGFLYENAR